MYYIEEKNEPRVVAFGFSQHNLTMMGSELTILWPGKKFVPCMNALDFYRLLNDAGGEISLLANLSREYHELDRAFRMALERGIPIIGAVATDFLNAYCLALCMEWELPAIIAELDSREELGEARDAIRNGRRFVSRTLLQGNGYQFADLPLGLELLSESEALCVCARVGGLSAKEIASRLGIEATTVRTYSNRAFAKLGVTSTEELAWLIAGHPMGSYHTNRVRSGKLLLPAMKRSPASKSGSF